jgi:hypothetical protein
LALARLALLREGRPEGGTATTTTPGPFRLPTRPFRWSVFGIGNYYDARLERLGLVSGEPRPPRGQIRAVRNSLGMSSCELASRREVVPRTTLEDTVRAMVRNKALEQLATRGPFDHGMTPDDREALLDEIAEGYVDHRELWSDSPPRPPHGNSRPRTHSQPVADS